MSPFKCLSSFKLGLFRAAAMLLNYVLPKLQVPGVRDLHLQIILDFWARCQGPESALGPEAFGLWRNTPKSQQVLH
jgi:hypothetical protein